MLQLLSPLVQVPPEPLVTEQAWPEPELEYVEQSPPLAEQLALPVAEHDPWPPDPMDEQLPSEPVEEQNSPDPPPPLGLAEQSPPFAPSASEEQNWSQPAEHSVVAEPPLPVLQVSPGASVEHCPPSGPADAPGSTSMGLGRGSA